MTEAIELLAEKLRTPLQIQLHLTLAMEAGYQTGEKPITASLIESVLSRQLNDLCPLSLICCIFFQREMPCKLLITLKPFSAPYSAVRSKRMSKHIVHLMPRSCSHSMPLARSNQLSVS